MTLNLKSELQAKIDAHVASGEYATPEDVVEAALRSLEQGEHFAEFELGELDALCRVGINQLDRGESIDAEDVFREIDERQAGAESESGK